MIMTRYTQTLSLALRLLTLISFIGCAAYEPQFARMPIQLAPNHKTIHPKLESRQHSIKTTAMLVFFIEKFVTFVAQHKQAARSGKLSHSTYPAAAGISRNAMYPIFIVVPRTVLPVVLLLFEFDYTKSSDFLFYRIYAYLHHYVAWDVWFQSSSFLFVWFIFTNYFSRYFF